MEIAGSRELSDQMSRGLRDLVGARIDAEDAIQLVEMSAGEGPAGRGVLADIMREHARRMDPAAFAIFKEALSGRGGSEPPERVLLRPGDSGKQVQKLRQALIDAAKVLKDRRVDPGPGKRFDGRCVAALRAFQTLLQLPASGQLDSASLRRMNYVLNESTGVLLDVDFPCRTPAGIELHFFPGDQAQKLVVRQQGQVVDVYDMRGGPAESRPDDRPGVDPRFKWAPTPRGRYELAGSRAHVTRSWKYSQIPFGAELRVRDEQVEFRRPGSKLWQKATGPESIFAGRPKERQFVVEDFLDNGRLPDRYERNDFGHRAQYLKNAQGRMVGHMIHATARGERNYGNDLIPLLVSHGCEHMRPADLDECVAKGYFRPGRKFVVHGYQEALPRDVREFLKL